MIVRNLDDIVGTDADVHGEGWNSRRLLLAQDGMGFSMHDTVIPTGEELHLWYKNHVEAVYCIEGRGEIFSKDEEKTWPIAPGTLYALNHNDRHILRAFEQLRVVCVFNPPVTGREVHDEDGSYALPEDLER